MTLKTLSAIYYAFCRELIPELAELDELDESARQVEDIRKHAINAALKRVLPSELKAEAPRLFSSDARAAEQTDELLLHIGRLTMAEKATDSFTFGALKGGDIVAVIQGGEGEEALVQADRGHSWSL
ncbi:hypothetical protein CEK62_09200 [Alcanivorax sp. N3-2A]|nr:hypothetical protein CEK62_09200 [Alcanivorax sp. N3-2A]